MFCRRPSNVANGSRYETPPSPESRWVSDPPLRPSAPRVWVSYPPLRLSTLEGRPCCTGRKSAWGDVRDPAMRQSGIPIKRGDRVCFLLSLIADDLRVVLGVHAQTFSMNPIASQVFPRPMEFQDMPLSVNRKAISSRLQIADGLQCLKTRLNTMRAVSGTGSRFENAK
jgi:hypothetical protein